MPQIISLTVHGRSYQVTCDDGQESHLMKLAQHIDRKMAERSEEHTSELQSLMRISYAVLCLKKKTMISTNQNSRVAVRHKHNKTLIINNVKVRMLGNDTLSHQHTQ